MIWKRSNIPIIGAMILGLGIFVGVIVIPEFAEEKDRPEVEGIPTLEKGMAEAMKSDCGSTNTILCEKLDKIIENQEIIIEQLTELYDMES
jgi:sugar phosphate permease